MPSNKNKGVPVVVCVPSPQPPKQQEQQKQLPKKKTAATKATTTKPKKTTTTTNKGAAAVPASTQTTPKSPPAAARDAWVIFESPSDDYSDYGPEDERCETSEQQPTPPPQQPLPQPQRQLHDNLDLNEEEQREELKELRERRRDFISVATRYRRELLQVEVDLAAATEAKEAATKRLRELRGERRRVLDRLRA